MTHLCLLTFKPKNVLKLFSKLIIVGLVEVGLGRKDACLLSLGEFSLCYLGSSVTCVHPQFHSLLLVPGSL